MHEAPCVCAGNNKQQPVWPPHRCQHNWSHGSILFLCSASANLTTSHIQAPSKTHCSIKIKPTANRAGLLSTVTGQRPLETHSVASSQGHCPQVHLCPTSRGTGQSGAGTSPLQGNDPSFHHTILSMMGKMSVMKIPLKI